MYLAEVAMQSRSAQTVQALLEAEAYPGPSLIIVHSPCIAHGYDLVASVAQQERRRLLDPRRVARGEAPLVLDSKAPKLDVAAYMQNEARFRYRSSAEARGVLNLDGAPDREAWERLNYTQMLAGWRPR